MRTLRNSIEPILTLVCLLFLGACGGGSGPGAPPPTGGGNSGGGSPTPTAVSNRSTFFYTEGNPRNSAYDKKHKLVFSTNQLLNQIDVFSTQTRTRLQPIPLSQPYALDLSPDGTRLWVGTAGEYLYTIDTETRRVVDWVTPPRADSWAPTIVRDLAVMANGSILLRMARINLSVDYLYQYFPSTRTFISRKGTINTPDYIPTVWRFTRSADGSKALVGQYYNVVLYDSATDTFLQKAIADASPSAAMRPDGLQIAMRSRAGLMFLDAQLNKVGETTIPEPAGRPIYSHDGRYVYVPEDIGGLRKIPRILVIDTRTFAVVGNVADLFLASDSPFCDIIDVCDWTIGGTTLHAADETGLIIGAATSGISFIDASSTAMLPSNRHGFPLIGNATPAEGSPEGGTQVKLHGWGLTGAKVAFGKYWGTTTSTYDTFADVITPLSPTLGTVNLLAEFPDGWTTMSPYGFSYGPEISYIVPGGAASTGGGTLTIWGYGFGTDKNAVSVQIGGRTATVQSIDQPGGGTGMIPMYRIMATIPPGEAGAHDVVVRTNSGSATARQGFRYLKSVEDFAVPGKFSQIIYDGKRQLVYLMDKDNGLIQVFSTESKQLRSPITLGGTPRDMVLLPDGARLAVLFSSSDNLALIDIDNPSARVSVNLAIPDNVDNQHPDTIGASADGKIFVGFGNSSFGGSMRRIDLQSLNMDTVGDICPYYLCAIRSSKDGKRVFFAQSGISSGSVSSYDAITHTFTKERVLHEYFDQIAVSGDGNRWVFNNYFLSADNDIEANVSISPTVIRSTPNAVYGFKFHESGGLQYLPLTDGLHIYDAQRGRLLRSYAGMVPTRSSINTIALDESGQTIFAITTSGLEIVTLDSVPLSIGHVDPTTIGVSTPSAVTIRGSGFNAQTRVSVNGTEIVPVLVDANTLQLITPALPVGAVSLGVYNPDGERFELGNAVRVQ